MEVGGPRRAVFVFARGACVGGLGLAVGGRHVPCQTARTNQYCITHENPHHG